VSYIELLFRVVEGRYRRGVLDYRGGRRRRRISGRVAVRQGGEAAVTPPQPRATGGRWPVQEGWRRRGGRGAGDEGEGEEQKQERRRVTEERSSNG
jgi:hypothetical protein